MTALFAGDSGTGKTMAAEVVAGDLGLDLYAVDLADAWSTSTSARPRRTSNASSPRPPASTRVLLFDEADAIFGKRSEVRDAHDRYANLESAYLLQRMESFDGLAILATNLRANIDEAFHPPAGLHRRLPAARRRAAPRAVGPQPRPTGPARARPRPRRSARTSFELAGGAIRSAAVTAAYLAADDGRPVTTVDVVAGGAPGVPQARAAHARDRVRPVLRAGCADLLSSGPAEGARGGARTDRPGGAVRGGPGRATLVRDGRERTVAACPRCGYGNPDVADFCENPDCRADLRPASPTPRPGRRGMRRPCSPLAGPLSGARGAQSGARRPQRRPHRLRRPRWPPRRLRRPGRRPRSRRGRAGRGRPA